MADPNSPLFRLQLWRTTLPPALRVLLTLNLALFAVVVPFAILAAFGVTAPYRLLEFLAMPGDPALALRRAWTPVTYSFVNLIGGPDAVWGIVSFAFAMYWLNWLGREYEDTYGSHRLFGLYLGSAVFGAVLALLLAGTIPGRPLYFGAWGPATAVLVAAATLAPDRGIGLLLLGVIKLKWIAVAFVVLSLFNPDVTFLGAALFGFLFAKAQQGGVDLAAWARPVFRDRPGRSADRSASAARSPFRRAEPEPAAPTPRRGGGTRDVDAILDKILEDGYDSLTAEEREVLDRASRD